MRYLLVQAIQGVTDAMRTVCSLHGAMPMLSPELRLSDGGEPAADGLTVLTSTGARLMLRDDLRRPFAAWLVESAATSSTGATTWKTYGCLKSSAMHADDVQFQRW